MKYTKEDLDYVLAYARRHGRAPSTPEEVAQLIDEVRREERERAAKMVKDFYGSDYIANQIRTGE